MLPLFSDSELFPRLTSFTRSHIQSAEPTATQRLIKKNNWALLTLTAQDWS